MGNTLVDSEFSINLKIDDPCGPPSDVIPSVIEHQNYTLADPSLTIPYSKFTVIPATCASTLTYIPIIPEQI